MSSPLLNKVDPDTLVLTVNRRLTRTLTRRLDQAWISSGAEVWPTPRILPLPTWLEQCWDLLLDQTVPENLSGTSHVPTLLTPWQERLLWEIIIAEADEKETLLPLLRVSEAAHNAQNAWKLLHGWQVALEEVDLRDRKDASAFHAWATLFETRCQQNNWWDHARLPHYLLQHLDRLALPKRILLAGFQRETPGHTALFAACEKRGTHVEILSVFQENATDTTHATHAIDTTHATDATHSPHAQDMPGDAGFSAPATEALETPPTITHTVRIGLPSVEAEILASAQWSRTQLASAPNKKVGIIIPALESLLPKVVETFSRVFYPGQNPATLAPLTNAFNISLGTRLVDTPIVKDALLLLELGKGMLPMEQYTALLHAPFWHGGTSEEAGRSLLDARLRTQGLLHVTTTKLQHEAMKEEKGSPPCPLLGKTLAQFRTMLHGMTQPTNAPQETIHAHAAMPSVWAIRFSQWLTQLGWPGEGSLTSSEHQNVVAWHKALAAFPGLDTVLKPLTLSLALAHLKRWMAEIRFQPESGNAPVQILGLLESVGETYDNLWVMGLSEEIWPPPLEPNPFLPMDFQRRHGMPKASFDLERTYNHRVFEELMNASKRVIVSHPTHNGDQPLRPSPMIVTLPELSVGPASSASEMLGFSVWPEYNRILFEASRMTASVDAHGPVFQADHPVGTGVLKAQAQCPFQAFSRFRLGASPQQEPDTGLDASQRGQIVHGALTHLWQSIHDTEADLETVNAAPDSWVHQAVQKTLDQKKRQWPDLLHPFVRQLEEARLKRLLCASLKVEGQRETPFTVVEHEAEALLSLGRLTVRMRMDRIDRLHTGGLVILDYKTGKTNVADWFGDRPVDPQLPLYALAQNHPIAAMAFCRVQAAGCGFTGLACQEGVLPRVSHFQKQSHAADFEDWPALEKAWRTILTTLGNAFVEGDANRDPLPHACTYCGLDALCRRFETSDPMEQEESP